MVPTTFGQLLRTLRDRHHIAQKLVVRHLRGTIDQRQYSRYEMDERAPRSSDEVVAMYQALYLAGVPLTWFDRRLFLSLAREKIETKKRQPEHLSEEPWAQIEQALASIDQAAAPTSAKRQQSTQHRSTVPRMEIGHLLGRESWLQGLFDTIGGRPHRKLVVLQGPPGVSKSSELHRLANHFLQHVPRYYIAWCDLPPLDQEVLWPESALEWVLSETLQAIGTAYTQDADQKSYSQKGERDDRVQNALFGC